VNLLDTFFSPEKRATRLEARLQRAILASDQQKTASLFHKSFVFLLKEEQAQLLSNLVLAYSSQVEATAPLETLIPSVSLRQAIGLLEENKLASAALMICEYCGYDTEAIEILAKLGRANNLAARITKDNIIDNELLETAVLYWEQYNGDIRTSPVMGHVLTNIAKFAPESLPANPRVKEITGQFVEAAVLYAKEGDLLNTARCYEKAEVYGEASKLYEQLGDNEGASRAAESMGDLEEALRLVENPERKFNLLIRMERFLEAREIAAGFESPLAHFDLIKEKAKERMEFKVKSHDFVGAMELADVAECEFAEREEILMLGRQQFDRKLASATLEQDLKSIYRDRVQLEEKAGHFDEAGRLAEEVLGDLDLASLLYEKANLFHKAIGTASGLIRLAELHEKGGNHLSAARLYESAQEYDKAFALYESIQHFNKAIECYLRTSNPSQKVLIRLYTGAGEFERIVDIYVNSGSFPDLEKALSIATTHGLTSHIRVIREKMEGLVSGSEQDLIKSFDYAKAEVMGSYSPVIGIDFGTTNSVVALFNKKSGKVEIVTNSRGIAHEPSFFGVDENGHLIFGEAARLRSLTAPDCAVARVKRSLGEKVSFSVRGKQHRCEEVVASLLQHLRSNAVGYVQSKVEARFYELIESSDLRFPAEALKAFLSMQKGYIHFEDVVLSVPAYFNDNQKRATRDSAEIAGLHVRRLLHEPTSAALAYSYQKPFSGKLAVIDLGGGTLDISILDIGEGINDVLTVGGDTRLGGSDIDAVLVRHVIEDIKELWGIDINETSHRTEISRLRDACENLKINLSSVTQYTMELVHFLNKPRYSFTLTRTELEHLSEPILGLIQATIKKTIKEYSSDIDNFILVGNATKMPAISDLARRTIRANELRGFDPGTVVATGAALEGSILSGDLTQILLLDIVPYSLGIVVSPEKGEEETSGLIEKDTRIPTQKSNIYTTKEDNQPNVHIRIYQGESSQPHKNYFLGDLILEGIPPAPAGDPQIEVTFDIGTDCILTVTAVDKATGNEQSIRIERPVMLSPQEKQTLSNYFTQRERSHSLEKDLEKLRLEVDTLRLSCDETIRSAERSIKDFFTRFHETVEVNPQLYKVNPDQIGAIQEMIIGKDQFLYGIPRYKDQFASTLSNLRQIQTRHLDFSDRDIVSKLKERIDGLSNCKQAFGNIIESVEKNVTKLVADWMQILESMEPDSEKMNALEVANYHLTAGSASKAKEILESLASGPEGLTEEAFHLLLKCHVSLGLKEEYRDTHRRFGRLFGIVYPDFSRLDSYLKVVNESVFMIQRVSEQYGASGSGFCLAPNLVVTNRHVIEGMTEQHIRVIGKNTAFSVEQLELDPINDLAILRVSETLKPLRLGEFSFVEPGEQILAIGFPSPSSNTHSENIYISKGIVNSIRSIDISPERVIFVDTKIGAGMSGGPLINDLGEVVGIVTLTRYGRRQSENGMVAVENQPVALPIHLVKKHLMSMH
jgi:molecular chaperone DnaK